MIFWNNSIFVSKVCIKAAWNQKQNKHHKPTDKNQSKELLSKNTMTTFFEFYFFLAFYSVLNLKTHYNLSIFSFKLRCSLRESNTSCVCVEWNHHCNLQTKKEIVMLIICCKLNEDFNLECYLTSYIIQNAVAKKKISILSVKFNKSVCWDDWNGFSFPFSCRCLNPNKFL